MGDNREIAAVFRQMGQALEILGANRFRVLGNQRVARALKDMAQDVRGLVDEDPGTAVKRLSALDDIGKTSAQRIVEYLETGSIAEHADLLTKVPAGLFDLLELPGLGPKAVKLMWDDLGIDSLEKLEATPDETLAQLPRMGAKTVANLRKAVEWNRQAQGRLPLGLVRPLAFDLRDRLRAVPGVQRLELAGSLRRGRETLGDLDFLAVTEAPEALRETFVGFDEVTEVLARGDLKCSVRLASGKVAIQADLRLVPEASWGAALMYFTGSKQHNVRLREVAVQQGKRLNEYGLFEGTAERPQDAGLEPLAAASEEEIYAELGFDVVPPELREDRGELDRPPVRLIEAADIRAELHAHTTASDGRLSIEELAREAIRRGFHTLAVTDHSRSQVIANGLSPERLWAHIDAVREVNASLPEIEVLAGSEVDILADGSLDYDDELLAALDVVVASPHAALRQSPEDATERLLAAIRHPLVHILGHPTGRILGKREGLSPDMAALVAAAVEHDTALELNANWHRLDLRDSHLRLALDRGCKIAIDTDAHDVPHFDFLDYGILTARRAGMAAESCINTWPADRLLGWLRSKRP
ncbi:MAG: DNA polymerase/3'-5' exonuclease PolX [Acidobacteriota bacterium]